MRFSQTAFILYYNVLKIPNKIHNQHLGVQVNSIDYGLLAEFLEIIGPVVRNNSFQSLHAHSLTKGCAMSTKVTLQDLSISNFDRCIDADGIKGGFFFALISFFFSRLFGYRSRPADPVDTPQAATPISR